MNNRLSTLLSFASRHRTIVVVGLALLIGVGATFAKQHHLLAKPASVITSEKPPSDKADKGADLAIDIEGAVAMPGVRRVVSGS